MASYTKSWTSGTGSITATYGGSGNGTITITSSKNDLTVSRSMTLNVAANGVNTIVITITQAAKSGDFNVDFNNDFL